MNDTVIKGTGDSRTLKGPPNLLAMYPTWEDAGQALQDGTFPVDLGPLNPLGVLQMGTGYTKGEVLPADLQAALGLPDNATPADAYKALYRSIYGSDEVIYRWLRTRAKYVETQTGVANYTVIATVSNYESSVTIEVANSVAVNPLNGAITFNRTNVYTHGITLWEDHVDEINNKYFRVFGQSTIYKSSGTGFGIAAVTGGVGLRINGTNYAISSAPSTTEQITEIVTSTDPNAYPVAGDGWTYTELTPVPTMQPCARTQSGSYVGTGTYGAANPNSLTFEFEPKLLLIVGFHNYPTSKNQRSFAIISANGNGLGTSDTTLVANIYSLINFVFSSVDGKTISWHSKNYASQQNDTTATYFYTAIG